MDVYNYNAKLCMSYLMGGTLGAHTIIHEACAALLHGASPVPRRIFPGVPA